MNYLRLLIFFIPIGASYDFTYASFGGVIMSQLLYIMFSVSSSGFVRSRDNLVYPLCDFLFMILQLGTFLSYSKLTLLSDLLKVLCTQRSVSLLKKCSSVCSWPWLSWWSAPWPLMSPKKLRDRLPTMRTLRLKLKTNNSILQNSREPSTRNLLKNKSQSQNQLWELKRKAKQTFWSMKVFKTMRATFSHP